MKNASVRILTLSSLIVFSGSAIAVENKRGEAPKPTAAVEQNARASARSASRERQTAKGDAKKVEEEAVAVKPPAPSVYEVKDIKCPSDENLADYGKSSFSMKFTKTPQLATTDYTIQVTAFNPPGYGLVKELKDTQSEKGFTHTLRLEDAQKAWVKIVVYGTKKSETEYGIKASVEMSGGWKCLVKNEFVAKKL